MRLFMRLRAIYLTFALLLLAACGQGLSGEYEGADGVKYSFDNGKMTMRMGNAEQVVDFIQEGKVLKFNLPYGGQVTLNILDDGNLQADLGRGRSMVLKKVK